MTTRHASLAPIDTHTFERERRRVQSKHLWDCINLNWPALTKKLYVSKPTGLSRAELWQLLFVTKHRANPWQEREYQGAYPIGRKYGNNGSRHSITWRSTKLALLPSALMLPWPPTALLLTMQQPERRLSPPRLNMPADGKQKKAHTVSSNISPLMSGTEAMSLWEMRDGSYFVRSIWIEYGMLADAWSHGDTLLGQPWIGDIGFLREVDI